jgi:DnaJ-class molecular chaperone
VLGVGKNAADIKRAFRKKARQFHPDRNPDNASAEAKFKQVQAAYDKIGTAQGRREYDQQQQMANMFGGGQGGMGGAGFEDMLGQMFGGGARRGGQFSGMGGSPFGSQSRGRQSQQSQRPKGRDINVSIDITTKEAAEGGTFSFTFKRLKPNPAGTMEAKSVTLQTQLKAGVTHGTIKRMKGQGNDHPQGDSGDVILTVRIDAGEGRFWDGDVLVQEVKTPYSTLALGGKVKVTLPSGKEGLLKVPPNTQVGDRRRMSNAGLGGGDLDLEFVLIDNEKLSEDQTKALEALRESGL